MEIADKIAQLQTLSDRLNFSDAELAERLVKRFLANKLPPHQEAWVDELIARAQRHKPLLVGEVRGVIELLEHAAQHLNNPTLRLRVRQIEQDIHLRIGATGTVRLTTGLRFGGFRFLGRITEEGVYEPSPDISTEEVLSLGQALKTLAEDPAGAAAAYARLTGTCCFCGSKLSTELSTAVGYGPICADHFGLPWGG